MPFELVRNDITRMHVDAVVNAANERLAHGGGVCGAIFRAAGPAELQTACDEIGYCATGDAVATPAFALPARHVIHTVGPVWRGGSHGEQSALRGCYRNSLALADELGDKSIAFPLISSGIYGYPKDAAINVAFDEIRHFLETHEMDVYLALFDADSLRAGRTRFPEIAQLIDDTYVIESNYLRRRHSEILPSASAPAPSAPAPRAPAPRFGSRRAAPKEAATSASAPSYVDEDAAAPMGAARAGLSPDVSSLGQALEQLDAPFSTTLMAMIDERGLSDSHVYKRANMSRQHFSKIRSNPNYRPKKQTVLALAVALQLSPSETRLLLERAGYALTHADRRDIIVEYFIKHGRYDIYEINYALYSFDQPLLS